MFKTYETELSKYYEINETAKLNITNNNYHKSISDKKIRLIEKQLRFFTTSKELKGITEGISIPKYYYENKKGRSSMLNPYDIH